MKHEKKYIGTFAHEQQALEKISELKQEGYTGSDIYVVSHKEDDIRMIQGRTDVELEIADQGGLMQQFKDFLNGEAPVRRAFEDMGIPTRDAEEYARKSREGYILIFVDREYGNMDIHIGDSASLDGTGIGQRRPINKDPIETYSAKVGAEAAEEQARIMKDKKLQETIMKTPRDVANERNSKGRSDSGLVGDAQHQKGQDRSIESPKNRD